MKVIVNNDKGRIQADTLDVVRLLVLQDWDTLMPDVMLKEYTDDGSLVRVLEDWSANPREVYMLYNHKDHLPEKVRLFIDLLLPLAKAEK